MTSLALEEWSEDEEREEKCASDRSRETAEKLSMSCEHKWRRASEAVAEPYHEHKVSR